MQHDPRRWVGGILRIQANLLAGHLYRRMLRYNEGPLRSDSGDDKRLVFEKLGRAKRKRLLSVQDRHLQRRWRVLYRCWLMIRIGVKMSIMDLGVSFCDDTFHTHGSVIRKRSIPSNQAGGLVSFRSVDLIYELDRQVVAFSRVIVRVADRNLSMPST